MGTGNVNLLDYCTFGMLVVNDAQNVREDAASKRNRIYRMIRFDFDVTVVRLPFDCNLTALRPL